MLDSFLVRSCTVEASNELQASAIPFDPIQLKNQTLLLGRARLARLAGRPEEGRALLEEAIIGGGWRLSKLWWELVALITSCDDFSKIRQLWLMSPKYCHSNRSILRAVARAAAVTGHHEECRILLRKLIVIVSAKSVQTLKKTSGANAKAAKTFSDLASVALFDLNQAFSGCGVRSFLISGTLLGQVRENGIIGWDKDIDVGFFSEECEVDLEESFINHRRFRLGKVDLGSKRLRLIHQNGVWIDVFPHYMEAGKRWHDGTATRWWNTPFELKEVDFLGVKQCIPDRPELYLEENYGEWRKPNPFFDARIDAPNVEITDSEHFTSLLYFGLESSIRTGKKVMAERYTELLRKQGEGPWLDRL